ncbi:MAG: hypothetical protein ABSG69_19645 [Candidatus Acidiferrum sp.]|jgi:hypothetical protein
MSEELRKRLTDLQERRVKALELQAKAVDLIAGTYEFAVRTQTRRQEELIEVLKKIALAVRK